MMTRRLKGKIKNLVHNIADSFEDLDCKAHDMAKTLGIPRGVIKEFTIEIFVHAKVEDGTVISNKNEGTCYWSGQNYDREQNVQDD